MSTIIKPYQTITVAATPDGVLGKFIDPASIDAENTLVYNTSTVEIFVEFGGSDGEDVVASVNSFPVPPKESVIVCKGSGNDMVSVLTESGQATVRITAIDSISSAGGNESAILEVVSVLKDAMGSQKKIDAAAKKIADAQVISDARKAEAKAAIQSIADAVAAQKSIDAASAALDVKNTEYQNNIAAFDDFVTKTQTDLDAAKVQAQATYEARAKSTAELQTALDEHTSDLVARETALKTAQDALASDQADLAQAKIGYASDVQKLADDRASYAADAAALAARIKKLNDATTEIQTTGDINA